MNVAFFLTPKSEVVWLPHSATMRQALERMGHHRYTAVPVLDEEGRYVGTLTEGDLLWKLRATPGLSLEELERIPISAVPQRMTNRPVDVDAHIEDLLHLVVDQNFVPVVDGRGAFIGIVRRRSVIEHCLKRLGGALQDP